MSEIFPDRNFKDNKIKFTNKSSEDLPEKALTLETSVEKIIGLQPSTESEDILGLLTSYSCYHPQCSFAYNISGNLRQPSLIAECVPLSTYQRIAALWDLDPQKTPRKHGNKCKILDTEEENQRVEDFIKSVERDLGIQSDVSEDLQVNADSNKSDEKAINQASDKKHNPYLKFLKSFGEDINRRAKSNLRKKAGKITQLIIKNFLDWYQSLGGNDDETLIDENTLQELFQIGFDLPEAKALVVKIKEMLTVPECLASLMNEPKHSTRHALRKYLRQDIKKEIIPPKMFAFGSMLPKEKPSLRYKPPRNAVRQTWLECSRVPSELDTMKTIWSGLEKLRSTVAFSTWLNGHPEVKPPVYLQEKGLLNINYEEWNLMYKGFEMDVDNLEVVTSDPVIIHEDSKVSAQSSQKSLF